jgi:hypothetical protein
MVDRGNEVMARIDVPGLGEKDIRVTHATRPASDGGLAGRDGDANLSASPRSFAGSGLVYGFYPIASPNRCMT